MLRTMHQLSSPEMVDLCCAQTALPFQMPILREHVMYQVDRWDYLSVGSGAMDNRDTQAGDFPFFQLVFHKSIKLVIEWRMFG